MDLYAYQNDLFYEIYILDVFGRIVMLLHIFSEPTYNVTHLGAISKEYILTFFIYIPRFIFTGVRIFIGKFSDIVDTVSNVRFQLLFTLLYQVLDVVSMTIIAKAVI